MLKTGLWAQRREGRRSGIRIRLKPSVLQGQPLPGVRPRSLLLRPRGKVRDEAARTSQKPLPPLPAAQHAGHPGRVPLPHGDSVSRGRAGGRGGRGTKAGSVIGKAPQHCVVPLGRGASTEKPKLPELTDSPRRPGRQRGQSRRQGLVSVSLPLVKKDQVCEPPWRRQAGVGYLQNWNY